MALTWVYNGMPQEMTFTLIIDAQEIAVRYRPRYFIVADYAHFEFTSPHKPHRRIPVSETGYRSHFSPMHEVEAAPSVEEFARALALALVGATQSNEEDTEDWSKQMDLF
jgi:hypothetical protein